MSLMARLSSASDSTLRMPLGVRVMVTFSFLAPVEGAVEVMTISRLPSVFASVAVTKVPLSFLTCLVTVPFMSVVLPR